MNHSPSPVDAQRVLEQFEPAPTDYGRRALKRFATTLQMIPPGNGRLLELGCDNYFSLLLREFTRYDIVTHNYPDAGSGYSAVSEFHHRPTGAQVRFQRDEFDLETGRYPYEADAFDVVLCMEVLEHLLHDPMAMLTEIHRVLKPDGMLVLTTPNLIGWHAILKAIRGLSPLEFSCFMINHNPPLLQHAKEYLPGEVAEMLESAGFTVEHLTTPYFLFPHERFKPSDWLLLAGIFAWFPLSGRHPRELRQRGPHIFVRARKTGNVTQRHPRQVYA